MSEEKKYTINDFKSGKIFIKIFSQEENDYITDFLSKNGLELNKIETSHCNGIVEGIRIRNSSPKIRVELNCISIFKNVFDALSWIKENQMKEIKINYKGKVFLQRFKDGILQEKAIEDIATEEKIESEWHEVEAIYPRYLKDWEEIEINKKQSK